MKIGITTFGCDLKSGMSRYITNLLTQFASMPHDDHFDIFAHKSAAGEYLAHASGSTIKTVSVAEWLGNPILNVAWHQTALPFLAQRNKYDVIFLPAASRRTPM